MQFNITDDLEESQPWQPLESILSVWAEMIHRVKAVALHDNVCKASYDDSNFQQDANGVWGEIEGQQRDPTTGAIRIGQAPPWTIMPWTKQDLTEFLNLWDTAIVLIEQRMSFPPQAHPTGLVDLANHEFLPIAEGFARQFLLQARTPRFSFVTPGFCVSTPDTFARQPFMSTLNVDEEAPEKETPPILMFRGDNTVRTGSLSPLSFGYPYDGPDRTECPAGLYLG